MGAKSSSRSDLILRVLQTATASLLSLAVIACASSDNFAPVADVSGYEAVPTTGVYRVAAGDTLYSIAWRYGSDYRVLAKNNNISAPYAIHAGQILYLRGVRPTNIAPIAQQPVEAAPPAPQPVLAASQPAQKHHPKLKLVKVEPAPAVRREDFKEPDYRVNNWAWPAHGTILSVFSARNKGIDIGGPVGSTVYASGPGKVVYAGNGLRGYGNIIIIKHNSQTLSAYAYNSKLYVQESDWVKTGQKIAAMGRLGGGKSGVHFEIRKAGLPVNPLNLLNQ